MSKKLSVRKRAWVIVMGLEVGESCHSRGWLVQEGRSGYIYYRGVEGVRKGFLTELALHLSFERGLGVCLGNGEIR